MNLLKLLILYIYLSCLFTDFFLQGSFNRLVSESSSHPPSLSVESNLKGLQVELSETCALCLSRLMSLMCFSRDSEPQLSDVVAASPSSDKTAPPNSSSQLHLLFRLDCCLEDVDVFTVSNVAGKKYYCKKHLVKDSLVLFNMFLLQTLY